MSKVNDLILFLDKNKEKKVGSVISEVREMCSKMGGSGDSVSLYDKNNKSVIPPQPHNTISQNTNILNLPIYYFYHTSSHYHHCHPSCYTFP